MLHHRLRAAVSQMVTIDYESVVLADSPKFYWTMRGAATAEEVVGNSLTLTGGVLINQGALRPGGDSLYCDGVNDRADSGGTGFAGNEVTVEFLYKAPATPSGHLWTHNTDDFAYRGLHVRVDADGTVVVQTGDGGGSGTGSSARRSYRSPAIITGGNTYHILAYAEGSAVPVLFVNGVILSLTYLSGSGGPVLSNAGSLRIGATTDLAVYSAITCSDLAIYDYALSPERAVAHAEAAGFDGGEIPETDPHWANVVTLLYPQGTDGSTTIVDETGRRTYSASGSAQVDTEVVPFAGTESLLLDGNGDSAITSSSNDFNFGSGDFTVEAWVRPDQVGRINTIASNRTSSTTRAIIFYITPANKVVFAGYNNGSLVDSISGGTFSENEWVHVAAVRDSGTLRLFVNGINVTTQASNGSYSAGGPMYVGGQEPFADRGFKGRISQFRITKGVARYDADFTPPTKPFPTL